MSPKSKLFIFPNRKKIPGHPNSCSLYNGVHLLLQTYNLGKCRMVCEDTHRRFRSSPSARPWVYGPLVASDDSGDEVVGPTYQTGSSAIGPADMIPETKQGNGRCPRLVMCLHEWLGSIREKQTLEGIPSLWYQSEVFRKISLRRGIKVIQCQRTSPHCGTKVK